MKSEFSPDIKVDSILDCLTYENKLACKVAILSGLRIGDIVAIEKSQLLPTMTIKEAKTGKKRNVKLPPELLTELRKISGKKYVFEGKNDPKKHRSRQAVWADLVRASKAFRVRQNFTPHSLRKMYAVELYRKHGDIALVQRKLNHDRQVTTMLYAFADIITAAESGKKRGKKRK